MALETSKEYTQNDKIGSWIVDMAQDTLLEYSQSDQEEECDWLSTNESDSENDGHDDGGDDETLFPYDSISMRGFTVALDEIVPPGQNTSTKGFVPHLDHAGLGDQREEILDISTMSNRDQPEVVTSPSTLGEKQGDRKSRSNDTASRNEDRRRSFDLSHRSGGHKPVREMGHSNITPQPRSSLSSSKNLTTKARHSPRTPLNQLGMNQATNYTPTAPGPKSLKQSPTQTRSLLTLQDLKMEKCSPMLKSALKKNGGKGPKRVGSAQNAHVRMFG